MTTHYDIIKKIMDFIKGEKNEKEISYVSEFKKMNIGYEFYTESVNPFMEQLNESKSIIYNVNDYLSKDIKSSLSALDQAIVNNFISMNIGYEFYTESVNPFMEQLNESKSIIDNVNAQLDKYNEDKLDLIVKYFIDTNIKSIESFNLHKKIQEELSGKMKLQSREIHRLLMNKFSNIPEPRFLPRIDYQKGREYFKNGFGNLTNKTLPTFSIFNKENNTSDDWRTDNDSNLKLVDLKLVSPGETN